MTTFVPIDKCVARTIIIANMCLLCLLIVSYLYLFTISDKDLFIFCFFAVPITIYDLYYTLLNYAILFNKFKIEKIDIDVDLESIDLENEEVTLQNIHNNKYFFVIFQIKMIQNIRYQDQITDIFEKTSVLYHIDDKISDNIQNSNIKIKLNKEIILNTREEILQIFSNLNYYAPQNIIIPATLHYSKSRSLYVISSSWLFYVLYSSYNNKSYNDESYDDEKIITYGFDVKYMLDKIYEEIYPSLSLLFLAGLILTTFLCLPFVHKTFS